MQNTHSHIIIDDVIELAYGKQLTPKEAAGKSRVEGHPRVVRQQRYHYCNNKRYAWF